MKVLLTGAAGRLGSVVCQGLAADGFEVRATDRRTYREAPVRIAVEDLLDRETCYRLIEGVDAIVHLANHPGAHVAEAQRVLNENVSMNMNLFQAAAELGVGRVVFASTIQTIIGDRRYSEEGPQPPSELPYLPMDGDTPPNPGNHYAVSKVASEVMLKYFCKYHKMEAVALRFPALIGKHWGSNWVRHYRSGQLGRGVLLDEGFTYLMMEDAAALIAAILRKPLGGFRIYMPTAYKPYLQMPVPQIIEKYFWNCQLRKPVSEMVGLSDLSRIERETGWGPKLEME